jgi:hypothetical protein
MQETWSNGFYSIGTAWMTWDSSCKTCSDGGSWDTWEDFMMLDVSTNLCKSCLDGEYLDSTVNYWRSWVGSWQAKWGYRLDCFECPADQIFHLETLQCVTEWNSPNVLLEGTQYALPKIWRTLSYYVDPDSEEFIELGTKKYPFRTFKSVSSEILNNLSNSNVQIMLYLKEERKVYIEDDTTFFINMTSISIASYSDASETPGKATLVPTTIEQIGIGKRALFHILQHTDLMLDNALTEGKLGATNEITINRRIQWHR